MLFNIKLKYLQEYLPTKRHKNSKRKIGTEEISVSIQEIENAESFPVAFVVHNYFSVFGGNSFEEFCSNRERNKDFNFRTMDIEIRTYAGKLYKARRFSWGAAIGTGFYKPEDAVKGLRDAGDNVPYYYGSEKDRFPFTEKSVVVSDNLEERKAELYEIASKILIYDGKIWDQCPEPMYAVMTFGLGHNHGGTALLLEEYYNGNVGPDRYFNALQKEQAIEYANTIAERRGDTNNIGKFGKDNYIDVLMPEMVKRNPAVDHKDGGNKFMNRLESIIEDSDDVTTAEIGVIAAALLDR